jgi:hypothetical protein
MIPVRNSTITAQIQQLVNRVEVGKGNEDLRDLQCLHECLEDIEPTHIVSMLRQLPIAKFSCHFRLVLVADCDHGELSAG